MRKQLPLKKGILCLLWFLLLSGADIVAQRYPGNSMDFVVPMPANEWQNGMRLYVCAGDRPADIVVTIRANAAVTVNQYHVAANSSLALPEISARLLMMPAEGDATEAVYKRSVSIHSSVPVEAFADYILSMGSGGTRLLPVRQWGYAYTYLDAPYAWGSSYLCVTGAYNQTRVSITPVLPTADGHPAGVPYQITLDKGEVYQVRLKWPAPAPVQELTGTTVQAVANGFGVVYPVGVYGGNKSMNIRIAPGLGGSADFEAEQLLPVCNLGKQFVTAPFSVANSADGSAADHAIFRVQVTDPATVVKRDGITIPAADLVNNYYEFITDKAEFIEASKPVMVAQMMLSADESAYPRVAGRDGEIIYLTPIDKAQTATSLYLGTRPDKCVSFVTLCVPTAALSSLLINGTNSYSYSYTHPSKTDYTVVVKKWSTPLGHCSISCSQPFTGIGYSIPPDITIAESVGFDISPLYHPEGEAAITGKYDAGAMKSYSCMGDTFRLQLKTEYLPQTLEWKLKGHPGLLPATDDKVFTNPVPDSTVTRDGHTYHFFNLPIDFYCTQTGDYAIPVLVTQASIDNCNHQQTFITDITCRPLPVADFAITRNACAPFNTRFTAGAAGDTSTLTGWLWYLDNTQSTAASPAYTYTTTGKRDIYLRVTAANGCVADTVKTIDLQDAPRPKAAFTAPALVCLPGLPAAFTNGTTYNGSASPVSYAWKMGEGGVSNERNPQYYYQAPGVYTVQLIATAADGCTDSVQQVLKSFAQRPQAGIRTLSDTVCANSRVLLEDASVPPSGVALSSYRWITAEGTTTNASLEKQYRLPGDYTVSHFVTSAQGCVSDTAVKNMVVYDVPVVEAGMDKTILEGAPVQLQASVRVNGTYSVTWAPGASIMAGSESLLPVVAPKENTLFYLTAATWKGCSAYDSVWVYVLPTLVIPNAFSPNGDGSHDRWEIPGMNSYVGAMIQVFNRYGQKVYESRGYAVAWDGYAAGGAVPAGTYYYVIHPGAGKPAQTGSLTIIR